MAVSIRYERDGIQVELTVGVDVSIVERFPFFEGAALTPDAVAEARAVQAFAHEAIHTALLRAHGLHPEGSIEVVGQLNPPLMGIGTVSQPSEPIMVLGVHHDPLDRRVLPDQLECGGPEG